MTGLLVVPTLAGAPPQNQSLEGFWAASCESRAKPNFRTLISNVISDQLLIGRFEF